MKKFFAAHTHTTSFDLMLLLVRIVTGVAFILHGQGKIQNPFTWMQGSQIPGIFQALGAVAEFGGGIALIIGALTRLASFGLLCTMVVAAYFHAVLRGDPFISQGGPSYELAIAYLMVSLIILFTGPGKFSLDYKIFGAKPL